LSDFRGLRDPASLRENIAGLERLLTHNRDARIVWAHAGWDNTGERTPPLMRALLERHPNLYMSLKIVPWAHGSPLDQTDTIRPGWLALLRDFPERFVIGSDQFFDEDPDHVERARGLVNALPADIAPLIARENALRIYRLAPKTPGS
jgi:predicted TIM-barrel fold metal-dependent hydrolase